MSIYTFVKTRVPELPRPLISSIPLKPIRMMHQSRDMTAAKNARANENLCIAYVVARLHTVLMQASFYGPPAAAIRLLGDVEM